MATYHTREYLEERAVWIAKIKTNKDCLNVDIELANAIYDVAFFVGSATGDNEDKRRNLDVITQRYFR